MTKPVVRPAMLSGMSCEIEYESAFDQVMQLDVSGLTCAGLVEAIHQQGLAYGLPVGAPLIDASMFEEDAQGFRTWLTDTVLPALAGGSDARGVLFMWDTLNLDQTIQCVSLANQITQRPGPAELDILSDIGTFSAQSLRRFAEQFQHAQIDSYFDSFFVFPVVCRYLILQSVESLKGYDILLGDSDGIAYRALHGLT